MSEENKTIKTANLPVTQRSLVNDFKKIGIQEGQVLLVHSSLSALGWVCGGPVAVVLALEEVLGETGTLVMPTFTADNSEPSYWNNPPVSENWWTIIRAERTPFMPDLSPTRQMGKVVETFRKQAGTMRSYHPMNSFCARGKQAAFITENHGLDNGLGETSPLARLYELKAHILLLGVPHDNNTSMHLAEYRANYKKTYEKQGGAVLINGERQWVKYDDIALNSDDFSLIGKAFEAETEEVSIGKIGYATSRFMPQNIIVDFAVKWMEKNRR